MPSLIFFLFLSKRRMAEEEEADSALRFAREAGALLLVPWSLTATALAFIHGWWEEARRGATALPLLPAPRLAAAALFLACKADTSGVAVRTNDLVNAVACVAARGASWTALAARPYAAAKATLLADEAALLRALRFQVAPGADASTRVAFNAAVLLGRSRAAARGAAGLCADALACSPLPRTAGPVTTACAALLLAGLVTGEEEEAEEGEERVRRGPLRPDGVTAVRWWEALGARTEGVVAAAGEMVRMLEREAARVQQR